MLLNGLTLTQYGINSLFQTALTIVIFRSTEEFRAAEGHFYTLTFLWKKQNMINIIHIILRRDVYISTSKWLRWVPCGLMSVQYIKCYMTCDSPEWCSAEKSSSTLKSAVSLLLLLCPMWPVAVWKTSTSELCRRGKTSQRQGSTQC